jgi:hypothetical protein
MLEDARVEGRAMSETHCEPRRRLRNLWKSSLSQILLAMALKVKLCPAQWLLPGTMLKKSTLKVLMMEYQSWTTTLALEVPVSVLDRLAKVSLKKFSMAGQGEERRW